MTIVEHYLDALLRNRAVPFSELTRRQLNHRNYQLAHTVVKEVLESAVGEADRVPWVTVPLQPVTGAPREPTAVLSRLDFDEVRVTDFDSSELRDRLRQLIVVPVVKPRVDVPADWWISTPVAWSPTTTEMERIRRDYDLIREQIQLGRAEEGLSSGVAGPGEVLFTKTNGQKGQAPRRYTDGSGVQRTANKRGFYLRQAVITKLVENVPLAWEQVEVSIPDDVLQAMEQLVELDAHATSLRRTEQGYLRKLLLNDGDASLCALCGRHFPAELLVAAHIKPRAFCSDDERRDVPAIAMLACRFGCDELFERGLLAVDEDGHVIVARYSGASQTLARYLEAMAGRRLAGAWPRGRRYFAWHRQHRFALASP